MAMSPTKIIGLLVLGGLLYLGKQYATSEQMAKLQEFAEGQSGPEAIGVIVAICFFGAIFGVPTTPLEIFAGYKYGFLQGWMIIVVGKQLGGMAAYWIGRIFLRDWIRKTIVPKWKILMALDGAFEEEGLKMALAFRSMYIPVAVKSYGCAALGCGFWQATLASMVFGPLYAAANIYAGAATREVRDASSKGNEADWVKNAVKIALGGIFIVGIGFAMTIMKKHLKKVTDELEAKAAIYTKESKDRKAKESKKAK